MKIEHVEEEREGKRRKEEKMEDETYAKSFGRLRVGNLAFSMPKPNFP